MSEKTDVAVLPQAQPAVNMGVLLGDRASPSLQIMLNDQLWDRCTAIANRMARAEGAIPKHLLNKPEACFAVVCQSVTWKLDPHAVARCTYETPGGSMGFFGSLCQAILENSGRIEGQIEFEHFGDWDKIQGKFKIETSAKGGKYAKADWKPEEENGLGVIVRAQVKGEKKPREFSFLLKQAFPRNSTLWATDPRTQICYTAIRRFSSVAAPAIFMGVPFDREDIEQVQGMSTLPVDITPPRPTKGERTKAVKDGATESTKMDDAYRETVKQPNAQPATSQPGVDHDAETGEVIENEAASSASDDAADEPEDQGQNEPEQAQDEQPEQEVIPPQPKATPAPTPTAAPPAQRQAAPAPAQPAAKPAQAPAQQAVREPPPAGELAPMTKDQAEKFSKDVILRLMKCKDTMSVDALKQTIRGEFRRLKYSGSSEYDRLLKAITDKSSFLESQEAQEDQR